MSEAVFRETWTKLLPFIVTAKPMTDLCWTCQQNNSLVYRGANISETAKSERLQKQEVHLHRAVCERSEYQSMVAASKATCESNQLSSFSKNVPCSRQIVMHYSFDYAQQIHLPSNPLQPGPVYFMVPRKVGLFGVCCEGLPKQMNFCIDEAHLISKGSNAVISYLNYFFDNYGLGEMDTQLHCDNCSGQNKNRFMLWYCAWRCCVGLHQSITLNFLIAGHTKFAPDGCFGLLKRAFKRSAVSTLKELAEVIEGSASLNEVQLVGLENGTSIVPVADWRHFLTSIFDHCLKLRSTTISGIHKY